MRNPHILNFCRVLLEREGIGPSEERYPRLVEDLYDLYENMLGRKLVAALPEPLRDQHIQRYERGVDRPDYDEIARLFGKHVPDAERIMKETLREFAEIVSKNIHRKAI